MRTITVREPAENEVLMRTIAVTFFGCEKEFAYVDDEGEWPVWARYELKPIPKEGPNPLAHYQMYIDSDKVTVVFEDKGQSEAEAVKTVADLIVGYLSEAQTGIQALAEEYIKCLR